MLRSLLLGVAPVEQLLSLLIPAAARLPGALAVSQTQQRLHQQQYFVAAQATGDSRTDSSIEQNALQLDQTDAVQQQQEVVQLGQEQEQQQQDDEQQQIMRQQRLSGPILPTHIILKEVREWQGEPPNSAQLFTRVNKSYAAVLSSRAQVGGGP